MVRVKKLNPPIAGVLDYVGVEVVRRRGDGEMR
jgi:dihydroneopterin aldolase